MVPTLLLAACAADPTGVDPAAFPGPRIVLRAHDPLRSEVATWRILVTAFENRVWSLAGDGRPEWSYRGADDALLITRGARCGSRAATP